ncbi:TadE family type IV pilus minor pilin [Microbacterium sp.]|uniref:TadE family type IV pilus minor pilin n=1 Tax=Microbacterium sp. TaxID=51671 RepID=UPI003A880EFF
MSAGDDRGSVTAELAVALPAVLLVIVLAVSALGVGGAQVRLEQAAAQGARVAARGEAERVPEVVAALTGSATAVVSASGDLVCVTTSADAPGPLPMPPLVARSCALGEGP